ncbi:MAG: hypothetical protein ACLQIB_21785 [Isosphaeraceae bacterium]
MATVSDDQRIREGLKFLTQADKAVIRASRPLEILTGTVNPPGIRDLLDQFFFSVSGNIYGGVMTQAQFTYLQGYTDSLANFADAISRLLIKNNGNVVEALTAASAALDAPVVQHGAATAQGGVPVPQVGCCNYDSTQCDGITQTYCQTGLQGQWSSHPCVGLPHGKRSNPGRSKR